MVAKLMLAAFVGFVMTGRPVMANENLLSQAETAKQNKDFELAIKLYGKVLEGDHNNMTAIRSLAWIRNDQGKYDLAVYWTKEGFAVDANDPELLCENGFANWKLNNNALAKQNLAKSILARPKYKPAYTYLIAILKEEGNTKDAASIEALMNLQAE